MIQKAAPAVFAGMSTVLASHVLPFNAAVGRGRGLPSIRHGWRMADSGTQAGLDGAALIEAIAARQDRTAFAALFGFYAPRIKTFLMRRGASAELAEDLAQEAMLAVWRKAASFDPGRATASAWIFAIARNLRIDAARRETKSQDADFYDLVMPEGPEAPDRAMLAVDSEAHVRTAMQSLPREQLDVVRLSYFEGKAHSGIAEALQIPIGTVKSRLRLATKRLRELLDGLA